MLTKVAIVMGSDSDLPVVKPAVSILKSFGIASILRVISAHRTPDAAADFARGAEGEGVEVIIAAAGKAAALPGVLAAHTALPVIGLPIKGSALDGMDALLSMAQMPAGVPVATVAINGAENAALLAVQIMGGKHEQLREAMKEYKREMARKVEAADARMNEVLEC